MEGSMESSLHSLLLVNNVTFWGQQYVIAYVGLIESIITNKSIQIVVFLILCAVTHFRKELSANHSYMTEENDDEDILSEESARIEAAARKALSSFYESAKAQANKYGGIINPNGCVSMVNGRLVFPLDAVLPQDMLIQCFLFLPIESLLSLSVVSSRTHGVIDRPLSDPSPCIFKHLWRERFGHLWRSREFRSAAITHGCGWNPLKPIRNTIAPNGKWSRFFFDFDTCWLDWCLVGHNRDPSLPKSRNLETSLRSRSSSNGSIDLNLVDNESSGNGRCLIGLYGSVFDVGDFLEFHPGSKETILDNAGGDATSLFEDVGHSNIAKRLLPPLLVIEAPAILTKQAGINTLVTMDERQSKKRNRRMVLHASDRKAGKKARDLAYEIATEKFSRLAPNTINVVNLKKEETSIPICEEVGKHCGLCRVFYDPFSSRWGCWWTCCNSMVSNLEID